MSMDLLLSALDAIETQVSRSHQYPQKLTKKDPSSNDADNGQPELELTETTRIVSGQRRQRQQTSQDIRRRVVKYLLSTPDATISAAARTFGMAVSTATAIVRRHEARGSSVALGRGGATTVKMTPPALVALAEWTEAQPDVTLCELKNRLASELGILVAEKTVSQALTKIGYTVKLLRAMPVSRNCAATLMARTQYAQMFRLEAPPDRRDIVWVDECGFNLHLRRKFGRARRGARASITVANGRGRNISICAAMSEEGFLHERLRPGAYNGDEFCIFLVELFAVLERLRRSHCWIILDNVRFHHSASASVTACATRFGHHLVFLPPYSPMLNPIESLFGKWKTLIRTQGVSLSCDQLLEYMSAARFEITVSDCLGWIRDMGRNIELALQGHLFE
jgi:transposase